MQASWSEIEFRTRLAQWKCGRSTSGLSRDWNGLQIQCKIACLLTFRMVREKKAMTYLIVVRGPCKCCLFGTVSNDSHTSMCSHGIFKLEKHAWLQVNVSGWWFMRWSCTFRCSNSHFKWNYGHMMRTNLVWLNKTFRSRLGKAELGIALSKAARGKPSSARLQASNTSLCWAPNFARLRGVSTMLTFL